MAAVPTLAERDDAARRRAGRPAGSSPGREPSSSMPCSSADAAGTPVLLLGGGSNLLVADAGFPGTVVEVASRGRRGRGRRRRGPPRRSPPASPGTPSSRTPSRTGGAASRRCPGSLVASARRRSRTWAPTARTSRRRWRRCACSTGRDGEVRTLDGADCGFGYRMSRFKADAGRWVVLSVTLRLSHGGRGRGPLRRARPRARASSGRRRRRSRRSAPAVLELRARKGMVLDDADPDTWSAGSFFTNPVVDDARRPADPGRVPALSVGVRDEAERGLADRARGDRQGLRAHETASAPPSRASTRSRSPTAAGPPPPTSWTWPRRCVLPCAPGSRSSSTSSRRSSASASDAPARPVRRVRYCASPSSARHAPDALGDVGVRRRVRQAQVAGGAERLAGHDRHLGLVQDHARPAGRTTRWRCRAGCGR